MPSQRLFFDKNIILKTIVTLLSTTSQRKTCKWTLYSTNAVQPLKPSSNSLLQSHGCLQVPLHPINGTSLQQKNTILLHAKKLIIQSEQRSQKAPRIIRIIKLLSTQCKSRLRQRIISLLSQQVFPPTLPPQPQLLKHLLPPVHIICNSLEICFYWQSNLINAYSVAYRSKGLILAQIFMNTLNIQLWSYCDEIESFWPQKLLMVFGTPPRSKKSFSQIMQYGHDQNMSSKWREHVERSSEIISGSRIDAFFNASTPTKKAIWGGVRSQTC